MHISYPGDNHPISGANQTQTSNGISNDNINNMPKVGDSSLTHLYSGTRPLSQTMFSTCREILPPTHTERVVGSERAALTIRPVRVNWLYPD